MSKDVQTNRVDENKGTLNITKKGDITNVFKSFYSEAKKSTNISEDISKENVDTAYSRLCKRWEILYSEYRIAFPRFSDEIKESHFPILRGEIELLTSELAFIRSMLLYLQSNNKKEDLIRAKEYKMAFMTLDEAINFFDNKNHT